MSFKTLLEGYEMFFLVIQITNYGEIITCKLWLRYFSKSFLHPTFIRIYNKTKILMSYLGKVFNLFMKLNKTY